MAQLRDIQTSQILHEGTPIECVVIARQMGLDKVLFDDVGGGFDQQVLWDAHQDNLAGLEAARAHASDAKEERYLEDTVAELNQQVQDAKVLVTDVQDRQDAIRAGQEIPPL